jgi:hypothetical protein
MDVSTFRETIDSSSSSDSETEETTSRFGGRNFNETNYETEKKALNDSKFVVPPITREISRSLLGLICKMLSQEMIKGFLEIFNSYDEYLFVDIWSIIVEYLLHDFDYDVIVIKYGICLTKTPNPVTALVLENFDDIKYMAFTVYNKNPGVDRFLDSMTVYLPTESSVKTVVITVEGREIVCTTIDDVRNATSDWLFHLFYSTAINDLLM